MKKIILTMIFFLCTSPAFALEGKVVGVSDGDTVTVLIPESQRIKVRLYGIDCPEKIQDFGLQAKQFTSNLVFGKVVDIEIVDHDIYGRSVGIINIDGKTLNEELLKNGFAWHYAYYCNRPECSQWKQLEEQAKASKIGLWAGHAPVAPWDFRNGETPGENDISNCKIMAKSLTLSSSSIPTTNDTITFTVDAVSDCQTTLYYYYSYAPDYGTEDYGKSDWVKMVQDGNGFTSNSAVSYKFLNPGYYVVVAWISPQMSTSDPINMIGCTVPVK